MAESPDDASLLFFDTFSHESTEELNLDLIQFPKPVCISEVRIIPLGYRVEVKVPGGVRLGATNPSSFKLEVYANNLSRPRAATFQKIGQIDYTEDAVQLVVDECVVTDGLAIKGWYSAVTLAVYGTVSRAKVIAEPSLSPPPPPPPPPLLQLQQPPSAPYPPSNEDVKTSVAQWIEGLPQAAGVHAAQPDLMGRSAGLSCAPAGTALIGTTIKIEDSIKKEREEHTTPMDTAVPEWASQVPSPPADKKAVKRARSVSPSGFERENEADEGRPLKRPEDSHDPSAASSFDHLTPEHSPTNEQLYMSDQEIGGMGTADDQDQEEMDSEEELLAEDIITTDMTGYLDFEGAADDGWNFPVVSFNPYQCDLSPLCSFYSPVLTQYQIEKQRLSDEAEMPETSAKIVDVIEAFHHSDHFSKWVEAVETLPSLLPSGLPFLTSDLPANGAILKTLVGWTVEGLDLSKAMQQPDAPFKVRQLKMGIRMAAALFSCDEEITLYLLECGVLEQLINLLAADCMSSSIKQLVLRAVDTCTQMRCGVEWFFGVHHLYQQQLQNGALSSARATCYQRLLDLILEKQIARTTVSISALLQKVHAFDLLVKLQDTVKRVAVRMGDAACGSKELSSDKDDGTAEESDDDMTAADDPTTDEEHEAAPGVAAGTTTNAATACSSAVHSCATMVPTLLTDRISDSDADVIISCLNEATFVLRSAELTIAQPSRGLPLKTQFEVKYKPYDPFHGIYRMFHSCKLLEAVFVCLSSPMTSTHGGIFVAIRDFLGQLLKTQQGLLYLFHAPETCNGIIRSLIQTGDFEKDSSEGELNPSQQLGLQLIHYLQALQFIDELKEYWDKDSQECDVDDAEAIGILHSLHIMTFTPLGKDAVVQVLGYEYNLEALLAFISPTGDDLVDSKMKESVCARYTAELLQLLMTYSENVDMLQRFSGKLLDICSQEVASRAAGIQEWLQPLKDISVLGYESLPSLISSLKTSAEGLPEISKALVTTLRLLRHLAVPPEQSWTVDGTVELKYKYAIVELYSADCFAVLINILQKLADKQLRTWQRGVPDRHAYRDRLVATIKPTLELVKAILTHLIASRTAGEFNDTSCLPALFSVYTIMCSLPPGGVYTDDIVKIQVNIVETLIAFTQAPPSSGSSDRDEMTVSALWISMVRELLKYVLTSPYTFLGGLMLLSELLPLPLPAVKAASQHCATTSGTSADQSLANGLMGAAVNCRRQWSMHLQPLGPSIDAILRSLAGTSCVYLQHVLRRVCWQLCDLSPGTAMLVCRCLLDALFESMEADKESKATTSVAAATAAATTGASISSTTTANPLMNAAVVVPPANSVVITCTPEHDSVGKVPTLASSSACAAPSTTLLSTTQQEASHTAPLGSAAGGNKLEASSLTSRTLGLISYLVCHPPAKAAILCMIKSSYDSKTDEKYQQLLPRLFVFLNTVSERHTHSQAQEFIVSILQSLCDASISLLPLLATDDSRPYDATLEQHGSAAAVARDVQQPSSAVAPALRPVPTKSQLQQLLSSLPSPREVLVGIAGAFFHHMADQDHGYGSILAALRTLVLLAEHDYGFSCIRTALLENPLSLYHLLTRINNTFSKDSPECVSALTMTVELLCLLAFPTNGAACPAAEAVCKAAAEGVGSVGCSSGSTETEGARAADTARVCWPSLRMLALSSPELKKAVNWQVPVHPLDDLEKLLAEFAVEDSFESVVANIGKLMSVIRSDEARASSEADDAKLKDVETSFLQEASLPLTEQFIRRNAQVTLYSDGDDEKMNAAFWLSNQVTDDLDLEDVDEKVPCNFEEWCKQYFKDFDLEADIKADNEDLVKVKPKTKYRSFTVGGQGGRRGPYVAPMRARPRGLLRGAGAIGGGGGLFGRPNDHFRTRAPNTSRPPSMHVDDFVKFEQGASSGGGDKVPVIGSTPLPVMTSNSDLMRRLDKTNFLPPMMQDMPMLRGRGRGFDRMRGRARFQTAPANFKPGFPRGFRGGRGGRMNFIPNQRPPMTIPPRGGGPPRIGNMGGGNNMPAGATGSLLKPYFPSPRFNRGGGTPGPFNKNDRRSFSPPQQKTNRNDRRGDMRDRFTKPRGRGGHYMPGPFRDRDAMLMPPPVRSRDRLDKMDGRGPDRSKHHRSYTK